jgi:hypothetical protein
MGEVKKRALDIIKNIITIIWLTKQPGWKTTVSLGGANMRYAKLGIATEAFADRVGEYFALSFAIPASQDATIVLDRPTLEKLQAQIVSALLPPQPPANHQ